MGTRIATSETDYLKASDKSWIGTRMGLLDMRSGTLDISSFSAPHIVSGMIPSGTALGRITATGKYGPFSPHLSGANEFQSIIATGGTAGDFTLTFEGETTAAIAYNATAAQVQAALELLSNIDAGDLAVTGGPLPETAVVVEFQGKFAGENVATMVVTDNISNGSAAVTVATEGGAGNGLEDFAGHLFESVKVEALTDPDVGFALYWRGVVKWAKLPSFDFGPSAVSGELEAENLEGLVGDVGYANHGNIRYEGVV